MTTTIPSVSRPADDEKLIDVQRRVSTSWLRWMKFVDQSVRRVAASTVAFLNLTDVPGSYTGQAGKYVRVKGTEDQLEFTSTISGTAGVFILPTADPHVVGALWNNLGTITISAG